MTTPGVPRRAPEPDPPPDLELARARVLAIVHGSATARRTPMVISEWPLRPLPPQVRARLSGAGQQTPAPAPRRSPATVAGPAAAFAVLDAIFVVVGFATGHTALAVGALVLFLLFAGVAVAARRSPPAPANDAAGLTAADRRTITSLARWSSHRPWTGDLGNCPERGVVLAAAEAAERIGRAPAYHVAILGGRPVVDVAGELDHIDEQAFEIATMRRAQQSATAPGAPRPVSPAQVDARWSAVVHRAAVLTAYAGALDGSAGLAGLDRSRTDAPVDEHVDDALTTLTLWYEINAGRGM